MITLGLDLGHTSCGWALIEDNKKIIDGGVLLFEAPEDEKGNTLASIRSNIGGQRNGTKRHKKRLKKIKKLCVKNKLVKKSELITIVKELEDGDKKYYIAPLFKKGIKKNTPLKLRTKGLDNLLSGKELTRVILHIATRRGLKYGIIDDDSDKEVRKIREAQRKLKEEYQNTSYRTYGEFLYNEYELKGKRTRNRGGGYTFSIHRDDLENELRLILNKQLELKNPFVSQNFIDDIFAVLLFVREPKSIKRMIGSCSLIENQKRASKSLYSSEIYVARSTLINLRVKEPKSEDYRALTLDEIELLLKEGHKAKIGKKEAKKLFNIPQNSKFKGEEANKETHIVYLKAFLTMKEAIDNEKLFDKLFKNLDIYEDIVNVLTYEKSMLRRKEKLINILENSTFSQEEQDEIYSKIKTISFKGYLSISTKAIKKILPYLEKGCRVDEAITEQDMGIKIEPQLYLPPLKDTPYMIQNPIVVRAVTQVRHLINAILKHYRVKFNDEEWTFDRVNIELAREINTQKEKKEIISAQNKDAKDKQEAIKFIIENCEAKHLTSKNIEKVRLWQQQDGICLYSLERIGVEDLVDDIINNKKLFERDHILPISRSSDNSISNKVLVLSRENQNKSNKTPYEYFGNDKERWQRFENYITSKAVYKKLGKAKVAKLTMRDFASKEQEFKERHLNDTRIISRTVKNYIEKHLKFKDTSDKRKVFVVSGKLTNTLRYQWGLNSKDRDNHYHHFEDAVLIAFANNSIINRLSEYYHKLETNKKDGKNRPKFTKPYKNFENDINSMIEKINIVRTPKIRKNGKVFDDNMKKGGKRNNAKGSMIRVDVFENQKGGYSLVPIYLKDKGKQKPLPNKTTNNKIINDNEYKFIFSLYPYNLISFDKNGKEVQGYYTNLDVTTGSLSILSMDNLEDDIFKKEIKKYTLKIILNEIAEKERKKEEIAKIANLPIVKSKKPKGKIMLFVDLKKGDIVSKDGNKTKLEMIIDELAENYSITTIKNDIKELELPTNILSDNLKLDLTISVERNKRASTRIGIGTKTKNFKKLKIDLLGKISEMPYEKVRKPIIMRTA